MKLALLGSDDDALRLVQAARDSSAHEVVVFYHARPADQPRLRELFPLADFSDNWEALLHETVVDAVIIARGGSADRDDQLRKLVQAGLPMLLVHPACETIVGFELDMIRQDTDCVMHSYAHGQSHPLLDRLMELTHGSDKPLGEVEQVAFDRRLASRTRADVLAQLARDLSIIRPLLINVVRVSAIGDKDGAAELTHLSVNLAAESGLLGRWTLESTIDAPSATLQLIGTKGKAVLVMPASLQEWKLALGDDELPPDPALDEATAALTRLSEAVSEGDRQPSWPETCRDLELVDSLQQSLRRGRMIELHREEYSEEGTFKSLMAAGSCLLMMIAFVVLIVFCTVEGVRMAVTDAAANVQTPAPGPSSENETPNRWPLFLRLWPVYPFALLLLLQLFKLVFNNPRESETGDQVGNNRAKTDNAEQPPI